MSEFTQVWAALKGQIDAMEARRKKDLRKYLSLVGAAVVGIPVTFAIAANVEKAWIPLVLGLAGVVFALGSAAEVVSKFKADFRRQIVCAIAESFGLRFAPERCISKGDYEASRIFLEKTDRYTAGDELSGRIGSTRVRFSRVHSELKVVKRDAKGRKTVTWSTTFKGVMFMADFNKVIRSTTVVLPAFLGGLGRWAERMNGRTGHHVTLEDPDFEKQFVVYADDEVEARYILTPSLMRRVLDLFPDRDASVSFAGSSIYVAIPMVGDPFAPRFFRTVVNSRFIEGYYNFIRRFVGMVDRLDLNTRIWTKA